MTPSTRPAARVLLTLVFGLTGFTALTLQVVCALHGGVDLYANTLAAAALATLVFVVLRAAECPLATEARAEREEAVVFR